MFPVPGPVAPPQWYGPLLRDLESIIPWYLLHFGCKTSYFYWNIYSIYIVYITK